MSLSVHLDRGLSYLSTSPLHLRLPLSFLLQWLLIVSNHILQVMYVLNDSNMHVLKFLNSFCTTFSSQISLILCLNNLQITVPSHSTVFVATLMLLGFLSLSALRPC